MSAGGPYTVDGIHRTSAAKPGRPMERPRGSAPPPPPWWRNYLLLLGVLATVYLLLIPLTRGVSVTEFTYTGFLSKVQSNQVATATIDPNGKVTGKLKDGRQYQTQIPIPLQDNQLSQVLQEHGVQISGQGPAGVTLGSIIVSLLPLLLLLGLFIWMGRRAGRQLAEGGVVWRGSADRHRSIEQH